MQLFIIRHAHALDGLNDAARPLSAKGWKQIRTVAKFLKHSSLLTAREFWHSPLVRARDTAIAFAMKLDPSAQLVEVPGLEPHHDPALIAAQLRKRRQSVAIVGHEPHLSELASLLVTGAATPSAFVLKKCAVLALERKGRRWAVNWLITPDLLG